MVFIFQERYSGSTGMQWPPMPGQGVNFIKPKGLVAAASMTSQTSMFSLLHICASSLTMEMLIMRNVFSSNLVISATSAEKTDTMVSSALEYQAEAPSVQAAVMPPMTLGVFTMV